ncbi:unnamed protein product [Camellia sinensis]
MDSEDDMHDANDAESLDDYYSGDTALGYSDDEGGDYEFMDNDSDDSNDIVASRLQKRIVEKELRVDNMRLL